MARRPRAISRSFAPGAVPQSVTVGGTERALVSQRAFWEITYRKPAGPLVKETRLAAKAAQLHVLRYWHRNMLPGHFAFGAGSRYHYARRTAYTYIRKQKRYGHNKPIYLKGLTHALLVHTPPRIAVVGEFGKLRMRGPFYIGIRRVSEAGKLSPDLKAEITTLDIGEVNELAGIARGKIAQQMRRFEKVEKKTIGK